ncbi:hypothetical protein H072_5260 [Dactylellina haptotyla CBS 200.50]|uniref:Uncharacterized protein n=1 Tax=Dactylellina haptotyla (strain CBS 200.50) TaxID=1284197 RepID=S8ACY5_DACHA|nr:hypothetical protein H072_5260 [Dactylellina haptotyla CBS 200.50]
MHFSKTLLVSLVGFVALGAAAPAPPSNGGQVTTPKQWPAAKGQNAGFYNPRTKQWVPAQGENVKGYNPRTKQPLKRDDAHGEIEKREPGPQYGGMSPSQAISYAKGMLDAGYNPNTMQRWHGRQVDKREVNTKFSEQMEEMETLE